MAGNDRSTERMQARLKAGINDKVAVELESLDFLCAKNVDNINSLCDAIARMSSSGRGLAPGLQAHERHVLASLARQASYWAGDLGNEVNSALEKLGCNDSPINAEGSLA